VCRLAEPRKNVRQVLQALAKLKDRYRFSYTVVGDGPLRPGLERLTAELGLQDRVRFAGFVDNATLRTLLAQSDLFVLTSSVNRGSHEGFGIAYLEANACGTPVLAARLAGAVEAVQEGVSGFFVDAPEAQAIGAALEQFFCRKVQFDRTSCRAFAAHFTWQRVVDHALGYYPAGRP
jgi:glycosyltransferase involved in cell wall biosynthesis